MSISHEVALAELRREQRRLRERIRRALPSLCEDIRTIEQILQARAELRDERSRALAAFEVVVEQAPDETLEMVLVALDKCGEFVHQGNWAARPPCPDATAPFRVCPLTVLAFGRVPRQQEQLEEAERAAERLLEARGLRAATFRDAWNAGLIARSDLLPRLNAQLTSRILKGRQL